MVSKEERQYRDRNIDYESSHACWGEGSSNGKLEVTNMASEAAGN